jgi:hypothetical protein
LHVIKQHGVIPCARQPAPHVAILAIRALMLTWLHWLLVPRRRNHGKQKSGVVLLLLGGLELKIEGRRFEPPLAATLTSGNVRPTDPLAFGVSSPV